MLQARLVDVKATLNKPPISANRFHIAVGSEVIGPRPADRDGSWPLRPRGRTLRPQRTLSCQVCSSQVDVGQTQRHERSRGVLVQPAVAHLAEAPQPLDHREDVLHARANSGLVAVLRAFDLAVLVAGTQLLLGLATASLERSHSKTA